MNDKLLTRNWSFAEGLNAFVNAAGRCAVVCFRFAAWLLSRRPAVCDSSSIRRLSAVDPAVPQRTTLTATSETGLLSDAVVVHRVHIPSTELHPNCSGSFMRSRVGRLFATFSPVDHNMQHMSATATASLLKTLFPYCYSLPCFAGPVWCLPQLCQKAVHFNLKFLNAFNNFGLPFPVHSSNYVILSLLISAT